MTNILVMTWISIGLGIWLGLAVPNVSAYKRAPVSCLFLGFTLTILLWPMSIYVNWDDDEGQE